MNDIINQTFNVPNDKIRIIHFLDAKDRKILHQYIENNYPKICKTSLYCKKFSSEIRCRLKECNECGYEKVELKYNHPGYDPYGIDESFVGRCPKCDSGSYFYPHYEDYDLIKIIWQNNIIALGNYFKGYAKPKHACIANVTDEEIIRILSKAKVYEINRPQEYLNKIETCKYIYLHIQSD